MTTRMDETRFAEIVAAYGAQARRWPQAERTQALIFAREHALFAEPLLREAGALDAAFDLVDQGQDVAAQDAAAELRVLAKLIPMQAQAGQAQVVQPSNIVPLRPRRASSQPWFWTGIGLAACVAGAVLGANLSLMSIADLRAQTVLAQVQIMDGDGN